MKLQRVGLFVKELVIEECTFNDQSPPWCLVRARISKGDLSSEKLQYEPNSYIYTYCTYGATTHMCVNHAASGLVRIATTTFSDSGSFPNYQHQAALTE